ncbi:MAG: ribosome maturation factor RimM [Ignavibacteria bacterium]|nr:ribosome maturation factor RimM [Ignavibacteria bacterium]
MSTTLCAIGRVVKVFGIKGELVVEPMTSLPERFSDLHEVFVGATDQEVSRQQVESVRVGQKGIRLRFEGCIDRNQAEAFIGSFLFVPESERISLPEGSYFIDDLVGFRVVAESGEPLGVLTEVMQLPGQDVYVVESGKGQVMVPAVLEFIRSVDLKERVMVVRLIDGFLQHDPD